MIGLLSKMRVVLFFTFIAAIITGLFMYSVLGEEIPIEEIKGYVESSNFSPVTFILIYIILSVFIPTTPLMAIAGILFGFYHGFIYSIIGGIINSTGIFLVSRHLGRSFVEKIMENKTASRSFFQKYSDKIGEHGLLTVITLRIMPIMPFNILSLLMGISKVRTFDYMLGTVIGFIPSHIITVYFGSLVFTEAFRDLSLFLSILLAVGLLGWILFRFLVVWRYFDKEKKG